MFEKQIAKAREAGRQYLTIRRDVAAKVAASGQFLCKCNYRYTDDYAWDNVSGFGRGEVSGEYLAEEIARFGARCYINLDAPNEVRVRVHSNLSYSMWLDKAPTPVETPEPEDVAPVELSEPALELRKVYVNVRRVGWSDSFLLPADAETFTEEIESRYPHLAAGDYAYQVGRNDWQYVTPVDVPTFANGEKVPVLRILITWSECPLFAGGEMFTTWREANAATLKGAMSHDAGGGYYKTGFVVCFADGHLYEGRIDLNEKDTNLSAHIRQHCEAHISKPAHMTQDSWDGYMAFVTQHGERDVQGEYQAFLDRYALEDITPTPEPRKRADVIDFAAFVKGGKPAEKRDDLTPTQRLQLATVRQLVGPEIVEGAMSAGYSPGDLFSLIADLLAGRDAL